MQPDIHVCLEQVGRFACLDGYYRQEEQRVELARALRAAARSEAHAKAIVDEVIHSETRCPKPAHFYGLNQAQPGADEGPLCKLCGGTRPSDRKITWPYLVTARDGREIERKRMPLKPAEIVVDGEAVGAESDLYCYAVERAARKFKDAWFDRVEKAQKIPPEHVRGRLGQAWYEVQEPCPRCSPNDRNGG